MAKIVPPGRRPATTVRKMNPTLPSYYIGWEYESGSRKLLVPHQASVPASARSTAKMVAYDQGSNQVVAYLRKFS